MSFPSGPLPIPPLVEPFERRPYTWHVPGSKSITNRAFLLAALADGETILEGVLHSDDTRHMRTALSEMGVSITDLDETTVRVLGGRNRLRAPKTSLFIGNSGTTVRFLTAFAALVPGEVTLIGDEHMQKRPLTDLIEGLSQLGLALHCPSNCPPITVRGGQLRGGRMSMRGDRSSQYFSAVLMAAPFAETDLEVVIQGELVSRPYVDITIAMMRDFGAEVENTDVGFVVRARRPYGARRYRIEPDASSASYAFAAAQVTGCPITVPGLGRTALQGDYQFVDLLEQAGATVERGETSTTVTGSGVHRGLDVDMHHISDTTMTLAAIAPLAAGTTRISNVANIRIKETDRLMATVQELRRLGQEVEHGEDWLSVKPAPIAPAVVHSYSDHRMAMSFAILGMGAPGVQIEMPSCVAKTYPTFWQALANFYRHLGQKVPFSA